MLAMTDEVNQMTAARPVSLTTELLTVLGIVLGLACFGSSLYAGPPHRLYAAHGPWPTADQITAYATAIGGAIVTAVNTALYIRHKLEGNRKPRRRRRKPGPAEKPGP